ncbi:hypothetical protein M0812_27142 [Anaeramoeba flamelloides]|uniref:Transmembrane protein n=1 Tax=Anaeramoeba flamelloides TaxID=1746091 RepID=A0AAV7Y9M1_9EUKA|nr:hypothetical protein M0812_27142 [Anaeramoeba flamelloides]
MLMGLLGVQVLLIYSHLKPTKYSNYYHNVSKPTIYVILLFLFIVLIPCSVFLGNLNNYNETGCDLQMYYIKTRAVYNFLIIYIWFFLLYYFITNLQGIDQKLIKVQPTGYYLCERNGVKNIVWMSFDEDGERINSSEPEITKRYQFLDYNTHFYRRYKRFIVETTREPPQYHGHGGRGGTSGGGSYSGDKEKRKMYCRLYYNYDGKRVIFGDESKIELFRNTSYVYIKKREKRPRKEMDNKRISVMIWGAISYKGKTEIVFSKDFFKNSKSLLNSEIYTRIPEQALIPFFKNKYDGVDFEFLQDHAPFYKSKLSMNWFKEFQLQSVPLLRHKLATKFKAHKKFQIKAQNSDSSKINCKKKNSKICALI